MKTSRLVLLASCLFLLLFAPDLFADQYYRLNVSGYRIERMPDGFERVWIPDYYSYGVPGYPDLPCGILRFAVPPDVPGHSIRVEYLSKRSEEIGKFNIRELPPMATRKGGFVIADGKADLYSKDSYFPKRCVEYLGVSQMRKWRFVMLKYTPFQYNPGTKGLRHIPEVEVMISYERMARSAGKESGLVDEVMDDRARELFENFSEASEWYRSLKTSPRPSVTYDYVIITTNAVEGSSTKLGDFVSYVSGKGYSPLVITEKEYGGLTGQSPNGTSRG